MRHEDEKLNTRTIVSLKRRSSWLFSNCQTIAAAVSNTPLRKQERQTIIPMMFLGIAAAACKRKWPDLPPARFCIFGDMNRWMRRSAWKLKCNSILFYKFKVYPGRHWSLVPTPHPRIIRNEERILVRTVLRISLPYIHTAARGVNCQVHKCDRQHFRTFWYTCNWSKGWSKENGGGE